MALSADFQPKRYCLDKTDGIVLVGPTIEATFEFETLDNLSPLDDTGGRDLRWHTHKPAREALAGTLFEA